jgi:hypothetical protein
MPPTRASLADSPFDPDMPTPPPPPTDEFAPPTPAPLFQLAPPAAAPPPVVPVFRGLPAGAPQPLPSPGNSWAAPPLNLQPPDTIDFSADAQPIVMRRSGPPGLLVLIVMLAAMAGGAKLAHEVTRNDTAALDAPPAPVKPATPTPK